MNHYNMQKTPGCSWSLDSFGLVPGMPSSYPKYMSVILDSVSRYMMVSTHITKGATTTISQIEKNIRQIHTQFGRKVMELLNDRGMELCNEDMKAHESKFGSVHRKTSPQDYHEPAERAIQTIETDIRTLLLQSGVSIKYWSYAAQSSVYTRNCTYNKKIKNAAVNVVSKYPVKVVLRSFLPFGCPATIWQQTSNKLSTNGFTAVTPCKDTESFGYFLYLPKTKQVISTTNYRIPNLLINLYPDSEGPNVMDKFIEVLNGKIADPNEIFGNKRDTIEVFKDHSKTLIDRDLEEFNDDILNDIEQDFTATDGVTDVATEGLMENLPEGIGNFDEVENKENNTDKDSNRILITVDDNEVAQDKEGVDTFTAGESNLMDGRKQRYENVYSEDEVVEEERINTNEPNKQVDLGNEHLQGTRSAPETKCEITSNTRRIKRKLQRSH